MRRTALLSLPVLLALAGTWCAGAAAQVIDASPCEQACDGEKSDCITACGEQDDPVECESQCSEEFEDCVERCD